MPGSYSGHCLFLHKLLLNIPMSANALICPLSQNIVTVIHFNVVADKLYRGNPKRKYRNEMGLSVEALTQLFGRLNRHNVKYLLVDGMACVFHGHLRSTAIVSLWIEDTPGNNQAFVEAVNEGIVPAHRVQDLSFSTCTTLHYGNPGFELNVRHSSNAFSTVDFNECYNRASVPQFHGETFYVISLPDLIKEKKASTKLSDGYDLSELQRIWEEQSRPPTGDR